MKTRIISSITLAAALSLAAVIPAFAQVGGDVSADASSNTASAVTAAASASAVLPTATARIHDRIASTTRVAGADLEARVQAAQARGSQDISARITSLSSLLSRLQSMTNISATELASFQATIQGSVSDMTALQAKIQSDTSTTSLEADLKSIAPDYRIYMLIDPQVSILAAADRVGTIVSSLQTVSAKLQTRLSAAAGIKGLATLQADLSDLNAKLADASTQSTAASAEVSGLIPDNGDKTIAASNTSALKDAHAKLQTASKDIQAAYKDAEAIVKGVKGTGSAAVSASTTPMTSAPAASAAVSASTSAQ